VSQLNFKHEKIKEVALFEASHRSGSAGGVAEEDALAAEAPKMSVFDVIEKHEVEEKTLEDAIRQEEEADAEAARAEAAREAAAAQEVAEAAAAEAARLAANAQAALDEEAAMEAARAEAEALAAMDPLNFEVGAVTCIFTSLTRSPCFYLKP
jgi:hypothetical protein